MNLCNGVGRGYDCEGTVLPVVVDVVSSVVVPTLVDSIGTINVRVWVCRCRSGMRACIDVWFEV